VRYSITGEGHDNPDGTLVTDSLLWKPIPAFQTPGQLNAVSWHNASNPLTQFNGARFSPGQFLLSPAPWLDGLTKCSFELSFMVAAMGSEPVDNGLLGRCHWGDQGQFALNTQTNLGARNLRMWVFDAPASQAPPAVNGTALIIPNHFYHLVVVYNGELPVEQRIAFYLNGQFDPISGGNGIIPASLTSVSAPLQIANSMAGGAAGGAGGDGFFRGGIWRVRVWPGVALTQQDAVTLFNDRKTFSFADLPIALTPPQAWELSEASGSRASSTDGPDMTDHGGTPSTVVSQLQASAGFLGVGIGGLTAPVAINSKPALLFPANDGQVMLDIGKPAGATKPANCTVAALCSTADITRVLNWIHASYDYTNTNLLNDINGWGILILDDNHRTANGSLTVCFGDGTNGNVNGSATLFGNGGALRIIAVFTAGNPTPTVYLNGVAVPLAPSYAVYPAPQPTTAAGNAGNSFIGNMADPTYPGGSDHYIRDVSLFDYAMSPAQAAALDAYLAGA
jgi:hypothetical protein